jgi:hypothetical protein
MIYAKKAGADPEQTRSRAGADGYTNIGKPRGVSGISGIFDRKLWQMEYGVHSVVAAL